MAAQISHWIGGTTLGAVSVPGYAILGARLVTVHGATIDQGTVVIRNGVVESVRNMSFCVVRPYEPFATSFVVGLTLNIAMPLNWLKVLLGALLIRLVVWPVVAQFCQDIDDTLFVKNDP